MGEVASPAMLQASGAARARQAAAETARVAAAAAGAAKVVPGSAEAIMQGAKLANPYWTTAKQVAGFGGKMTTAEELGILNRWGPKALSAIGTTGKVVPVVGEALMALQLAHEGYDATIGTADRRSLAIKSGLLDAMDANNEKQTGIREELLSDMLDDRARRENIQSTRELPQQMATAETLRQVIDYKREQLGRMAVRMPPSPLEMAAHMLNGL